VVDIVRAVDPLKQGLNYYIETIEELNSVSNKTATASPETAANTNNIQTVQQQQQLFSIDMDSGVIKTTKPRSFYKSEAIYKLNLRITSKLNDNLTQTFTPFLLMRIRPSEQNYSIWPVNDSKRQRAKQKKSNTGSTSSTRCQLK